MVSGILYNVIMFCFFIKSGEGEASVGIFCGRKNGGDLDSPSSFPSGRQKSILNQKQRSRGVVHLRNVAKIDFKIF